MAVSAEEEVREEHDPVAATRGRVEAALRRGARAAPDSGAPAARRARSLFDAQAARPAAPEPGRRAGAPGRPREDPKAEAPESPALEMMPEAVRARVEERLDEAEGRKASHAAASERAAPRAAPIVQIPRPRRTEPVPVALDPVVRSDSDDPEADPADRDEPANDSVPDPVVPRPLGVASRIAALIATCGFLGRIPPAPGTLGALAGLGAFYLASLLPDPAPGLLFLAATLVGVWAAGRHARDLGQKDPSAVVVDEFCGMWLALLAANPSLLAAGVAFFAFRLLDILKPPPIRQAERLPGGLGIMADDLLAGAAVRAGLFVAVGL